MRHLLIDGDILAYQSSAGTQRDYDWGDGVTSRVADPDDAKAKVQDRLGYLCRLLDADTYEVILSDDFNNFRSTLVDPTYKTNRTGERPEVLYEIKSWLKTEFPSRWVPTLEADDVMGIMATDPADLREVVMVSDDKDMLTIPGLLFRPCKHTGGKPKITEQSVEAADRFHLWQTLCGDATDGYPGCYGMGPKGADEVLDHRKGCDLIGRTMKAGPRKGTVVYIWEPSLFKTRWQAIVSVFAKAAHRAGCEGDPYVVGERHALTQARLARILRHSDWDGRRPLLWTP